MQQDIGLRRPRHKKVSTSAGLDLAALRAVRSATRPDWSPIVATEAAPSVLEAAGWSARRLRRARRQVIEQFPPSTSRIGARAVLILTFALADADVDVDELEVTPVPGA